MRNTGERKAWADKRAEIMGRPGAGASYEAARIRFELGEAVRLRCEEPGLTGTVPLLERLAEALEMRLGVRFRTLREAG
ncbi:XRE family transcriptional regulator [Actinocorallia populi]|uniref:XRE family transcriptional regulator n=1 Tax=Actinocorallia populi TaxID=2079200 RepID=UPI000D08BD38|nr:XRE family transcriptional regulator [Actinocorallia populi]